MHRSQDLRQYTGWLFGEIDFVGVLDNEKELCIRLCCPRGATCSAEALFVDQIKVLRETISVEEKLEVGGLSFLLNNYLLLGRTVCSWKAGSDLLLIPGWRQKKILSGCTIQTSEWVLVTYILLIKLHVMAQSPGIYNILAKTFKVIQCTATLKRADIPNHSINMIERSYALLSSTLLISPARGWAIRHGRAEMVQLCGKAEGHGKAGDIVRGPVLKQLFA
ncbi:hypothetical protein DFH09DRAFT_1090603 [Mycena vulgaris]|nr:hypothetical protein DFH09DRAFT_1090603 [Mycena vulgaris]